MKLATRTDDMSASNEYISAGCAIADDPPKCSFESVSPGSGTAAEGEELDDREEGDVLPL